MDSRRDIRPPKIAVCVHRAELVDILCRKTRVIIYIYEYMSFPFLNSW
jgi:hypothetical protein